MAVQELTEVLGVELRDDLHRAATEAPRRGLHGDDHVGLARRAPASFPACLDATDEGPVDLDVVAE